MQGEPWWTSWTMWCQITVKEVSELLLLINYYYQNYFKIMPTSVYFIQTPITGCSIGGCWWKFNWSCNYGVCRQNPVIWAFICNLFSSTFTWCYLYLCILQHEYNFFLSFASGTFGREIKEKIFTILYFILYWIDLTLKSKRDHWKILLKEFHLNGYVTRSHSQTWDFRVPDVTS